MPVSMPGRISPLATIEDVIVKKYPKLAHISPAEHENLRGLRGRDGMILLDVREPSEFAVSHLAGAHRVDPDASLESLLATTGVVDGKSIIFYCSVGARSAELAQRMQERLTALGADAVANLSGGIFKWHNDERALVDGSGSTNLVHGYSAYWGQLIRRKELIAVEPPGAKPGERAMKGTTKPAS
ncbi:MAG: rhodanese-like domain-containing protein [Alphaproteobacteria bacterium]|nr:rhodanese-like domain-containing protein [Alphaproteobacteria bacterium]